MRFVTLAALTALAAALSAAPAAAQKNFGQKPDPGTVTEIAGKSVDVWISEIHSKDPSKRENAIRTVLLFGPEHARRAVPALIAELKKHSLSYPVDVSIRVNASIALGEILGACKNLDPKEVNEAVVVLVRMLRDTQAVVKYRAAQALGNVGPEARAALPDLLYTLHDPATWETRQAAAVALGRVARDPKHGANTNVLSELFKSVRGDSSSQVRLAAVQALVMLGPPAAPAYQQQEDQALEYVAVKDPDRSVQLWAHMAAMMVRGKVEQRRVNLIGGLMNDKEQIVRIEAIQALGTIGPEAASQVPRLIAGLGDNEKAVAGWSAWALSRMGKEARAAVPNLQQLAKNSNYPEAVRQMATEAVSAIEGRTPSPGRSKTEFTPPTTK
jgi:HEAT repeat protein